MSNFYRCRDCSEKKDPNASKMKAYDNLDNAILLFRPNTNVDEDQMRRNKTPKLDEDCYNNQFMCANCKKYVREGEQFICLECNRQPLRSNIDVDYC